MTQTEAGRGKVIAGLVLGICALVLSPIAILSIPLGIAAIVLGSLSLKSGSRGMAISGIVTGSLGVLVGIASILIVFLALPAAQRSQRDASRKTDVSAIVSDVDRYMVNHYGEMPEASLLDAATCGEVSSIAGVGSPTTEIAVYTKGKNCSGQTGSRAFKVTVMLEAGEEYCSGSWRSEK